MLKVLPLPRPGDEHQILPPCFSTMDLHIDRPSPAPWLEPGVLALLTLNDRLKIRSRLPSSIPIPVSAIEIIKQFSFSFFCRDNVMVSPSEE